MQSVLFSDKKLPKITEETTHPSASVRDSLSPIQDTKKPNYEPLKALANSGLFSVGHWDPTSLLPQGVQEISFAGMNGP